MQHIRLFVQRFPWRLFLVGLSLAVGLMVPSIYELGQKPAARSSHDNMEFASIIVLMTTMTVCLLYMVFRRTTIVEITDEKIVTNEVAKRRTQFKLSQVFIGITVLAIILGLGRLFDGKLVNGVVAAAAGAIAVWGYFQGGPVLARLGTLYAAMFLPGIWVIPFNKPFGYVTGLAEHIATCPGLLFAGLTSALFRINLHEAGPLLLLYSAFQLFVGAWLAKRGGKMLVAYILGMLIISSLSSVIMHALYRA